MVGRLAKFAAYCEARNGVEVPLALLPQAEILNQPRSRPESGRAIAQQKANHPPFRLIVGTKDDPSGGKTGIYAFCQNRRQVHESAPQSRAFSGMANVPEAI
jgi:hypothetical protein